MKPLPWFFLGATCIISIALSGAARADDADALTLQSAPEPTQNASERRARVFIEVAAGRIAQHHDLPGMESRRLSVDLNWSTKLAPGWRVVVSDRIDDTHPFDAGTRSTLNSLRELYASWQDDAGSDIVEFGRINLRHGTAYGYNPTDVFRDGALRAATTVDPISLRENRLGTVMLRGQHIWSGGAISLALAPKLASQSSNGAFNLDVGATNRRNRALFSYSGQYSDRVSGQVLAAFDDVRGSQIGASMTALLSDAAVAHLEWSRGRDDNILGLVSGTASDQSRRNRLATGLTFTTSSRLSITGEYEYNGFAASRGAWLAAFRTDPDTLGRYLVESQRRQENASRGAYLVYVMQKGALLKHVDLTALLRVNADDRSRLGWLELRYHMPRIDWAVQWQQTSARGDSEYGFAPLRRSVQLLGAYYF